MIIALVVLLAASLVVWMAGMARGEEEKTDADVEVQRP